MPNANAALLTLALVLVAGCSKPVANTAGGGNAPAASTSAGDDDADNTGPPLDCTKVFAPSDAAGILTEPATVSVYSVRPRSCHFETASGAGLNVYADPGTTSELAWDDVTKSTDSTKYTPLAGVGDQAIWKTSDASEFFAKKGAAYCTVVLVGAGQSGTDDDIAKPRDAAFAQKLGALCNKVFAAG